jgi:hypothetical protein
MKSLGMKEGSFYIFQLKEVTPFMWHIVRINNFDALLENLPKP